MVNGESDARRRPGMRFAPRTRYLAIICRVHVILLAQAKRGSRLLQDPEFIVRFWGVRGSIAAPGPSTARYGGNTSCVEVRCGGELFIFCGGLRGAPRRK